MEFERVLSRGCEYSDHSLENGVLLIPVVRDEDFGVYVCSARNKLGFIEATTELIPGGRLVHLDLPPFLHYHHHHH